MSLLLAYLSAACVVALAAVVSGCNAQAAPVTPPTRPFLVVANQRTSSATLVELASGRVSNVNIGGDPHEVAISPDGRLAALTIPSERLRLRNGRRVVVLDLATAKVARTVDIGDYKNPHGVAFVSDSVALVGTLEGTSAVYVDVKNGRVLRAVEGVPANPYIVKLTSTGRAYVSSPHSSSVTEIDVAAGRLTRSIQIPDDPSGIAVSADGKELYAAVWRQNTGGGITIYDLDKGVVAAKLPAEQPRRLTVTADAKYVIVSDESDLRIIDRATRQQRSVALGQNAYGSGVACAPDSVKCYVALSQVAQIVEVDVVAGRVLRRFATQKGADGLAYVAQ